jgi:hypothetical protein
MKAVGVKDDRCRIHKAYLVVATVDRTVVEEDLTVST